MDLLPIHGAGNSSVINNIIESYTVSSDGNINAGDLCEFINGQVRKTGFEKSSSNITQINSTYTTYLSAMQLTPTSVLVCYCNANNGHYLYAVYLTISNNSINALSPIEINSVSSSYISAVALSYNTVIVTYRNDSNTYLYYIPLTIATTGTISIGNTYQINSVVSYNTSLIKLSSSVAILTYFAGSTIYLYGVTLNTNGTIGTISQISLATTGTYSSLSSQILDSNSAFVCYTNSSGYLSGLILFINGTNITYSTPTQLNTTITNYASCALIDSTHILICYENMSSFNYLYAMLVTFNIELESLSVSSIVQLNSISSTYVSLSVFGAIPIYSDSYIISSVRAIVFYCDSSQYVNYIVLNITTYP